MKFFVLTVISLMIICASAQVSQCGPGKVANANSICIEPVYLQGCKVYETEMTCHQCEEGYQAVKGKCNVVPSENTGTILLGCLLKSQDGKLCENCANGYFKSKGQCLMGIKNCAVYSETGNCLKCKQDYSYVLSECRHNVLLGCKREENDHTCTECWQPFKLNGKHCDISSCQTLNDYGCVTCQCGFYLTSDRKCNKVDDGCLRYERGKCINCLPHYKLKGNSCEIEGCLKYDGPSCTECKPFYDNLQGGCKMKFCYDWSGDQCLICEEGYQIEKGLCVRKQEFTCE